MTIRGTIYNKDSKLPVPYASIELQNFNGQYLGVGVPADQYGNFTLNSLQLGAGTYIEISSTGFLPVVVPYEKYISETNYFLTNQPQSLPEITIHATPKEPNPAQPAGKKILVWGAVALIAYALKDEIKKLF